MAVVILPTVKYKAAGHAHTLRNWTNIRERIDKGVSVRKVSQNDNVISPIMKYKAF